MGIGDQGRLNYLKNSIKKKSIIYESDKKFLYQVKHRLEETHYPKIIRSQKQKRYIPRNYPQQVSRQEFSKKIDENSSEKILVAMLHEIHEIKQRQLRTVDQIQVLSSKLEKSKNITNLDQFKPNYVEKIEINDVNKTTVKTLSFVKESSKIMIWSASGLSILWYAGFLNLITLGEAKDIFLGISIGLASGVVILQRLQKFLKK